MGEDLVVSLDSGNGDKDCSAASQGAKDIRENSNQTNNRTTDRGSDRDNAAELLSNRDITVSNNHNSLGLEHLGNVARAGTRDLSPGLGKDGGGNNNEDSVEDSLEGIPEGLENVEGRLDVVSNTRHSEGLSTAQTGFPDTQEADEQVARELLVESLGDQGNVGGERSKQVNGHGSSVEKSDGEAGDRTAHLGRLDRDLDSESEQVDSQAKGQHGSIDLEQVRKMSAEKSLDNGLLEALAGEAVVNESSDGSSVLSAPAVVVGREGEGLPENLLANVDSGEERNTVTKTVSLVEDLIHENDHQTGAKKLQDQQDNDSRAELARSTVQTRKDNGNSMSQGDEDSQELLGALEQLTIGLDVKVDIQKMGTAKQLKDEASSDDGGGTDLHKSSTCTGQNGSKPVKGIRRIRGDDAVEGHFAHDEKGQGSDDGPSEFFIKRHFFQRQLNFRENGQKGLDQVKQTQLTAHYDRDGWMPEGRCGWRG